MRLGFHDYLVATKMLVMTSLIKVGLIGTNAMNACPLGTQPAVAQALFQLALPFYGRAGFEAFFENYMLPDSPATSVEVVGDLLT